MKFEKLPCHVTATQWHKPGDHPRVIQRPAYQLGEDYGWLITTEGGYVVKPGDWILEDEFGKFRVITEQLLRKLYKEVP